MSPYQIAQQWLDAEKMREEARQLSNKRLSASLSGAITFANKSKRSGMQHDKQHSKTQ